MSPLEASLRHVQSAIKDGPKDVTFGITARCWVSLEFDKGQQVTRETLIQGLAEKLAELIIVSDGYVIDRIHVAEVSTP